MIKWILILFSLFNVSIPEDKPPKDLDRQEKKYQVNENTIFIINDKQVTFEEFIKHDDLTITELVLAKDKITVLKVVAIKE